MVDRQQLPNEQYMFTIRSYLSPPKLKGINFFPIFSEIHYLITGKYEHNNNALCLSSMTVIVQKNIIIKLIYFTMLPYCRSH